jgi:hypothetical protein
MRWRARAAAAVLGCLLLSAGCLFLLGCGGGSETSTTTATKRAAKQVKRPPTPEDEVAHYMRRRFGDASWYPLITNITLDYNSTVTVETKLKNRKTPVRNLKRAEVMCKAFLASPRIKRASILYDAGPYNEVFSC